MSGSIEREIKELEQKLEAKKREAAEKGEEALPEKEVFREVVKEHIDTLRASPSPAFPLPPKDVQQKQPPKTGDHIAQSQEDIKALVDLALTKSIEDAVRIAEKESPYLLDALHDHLADEYYDKLIALRKISTF